MVQFDLDFQSPLIFDDSLDFSDPEESRFVGAYSDGLLTKSGGVLSMSAFDKGQKGEFSGELLLIKIIFHSPSVKNPP